MIGWVLQDEDESLPTWLKDNLKSVCDCGGKMENYYNDNSKITSRRCNNVSCPYRLAQKVVSMCEILGVKGIGPERALSLIKSHNLTSQYEAIPHIVKDKPTVSLYDFLRMAFVKGIDKSWADVVNKCETLDDCFTKYTGEYSTVLRMNKELLYDGLKYVNIAKAYKPKFKPVLTGTVMLSGTLRGFPDRNMFIGGINYVSQGLVDIRVAESKRKTGVMALIQEADAPNRGKAECALENGIPIMTPDEFKVFIKLKLNEAIKIKKVELAE